MIELLRNVRVLECTVLPTGDQAGRLLGDLGAQSIKVEQPGIGDYIRDLGDMMAPRHSTTHMLINRHKRSITLNLRSDAGREVFYKILPTIDIFVDGFAGDACERLGVGYEAQRKVKPDIIYCQTNGFGTRGPYGQIPVHGYMMGATAGSTQLKVREDGLVQEAVEPSELNFPGYVDGPLMGGLFGAFTAVAALNYRNETGKGCYIDSSGTDATLAVQSLDASCLWNRARTDRGINLPPTVGQDPTERPKYAFYVTKDDKFVLLAAIEHKFWDNFCDVIERPDLREMKYLDSPVDFRNQGGDKNLAHILRPIMASRTLAEWMDIATKYDIPLSPANSVEDTLADPHLRAREIIHESVHPVAGPFTTVGWPAPVDGQPFDVERHAPTLGEHTDEILAEVGYSADDIHALRERGIV
jgi:crotonobetainyl-CoA:carnitine CoA-transferase CaiB-like acyl-CoA transferase